MYNSKNWEEYKYLLAYTIPVCTFISIYLGHEFSYLTVIFVFIFVPIIERIIPSNDKNENEYAYIEKSKKKYYDLLLIINVVLIFGLIFYFGYTINTYGHSKFEILGMVLSLGICLGSNGINVAHELGHKSGRIHQFCAKMLLLPSFYMHFIIEHNKGHHVNVGTLEDPATSRYNEVVYSFWFRSVINSFLSAWRIETKELRKRNAHIWSLNNEIIIFLIIQASYLILLATFFSTFVATLLLVSGIIGITLLETINYVEHYGLLRKRNDDGRYERVENFHSWNSNHEVGRILLYELTRHSDHHFKSFKKYQTLLHYDESPQLPYGYPTSILIALFPSIWFSIMNPLVLDWKKKYHNYPTQS